MMPIPLRPDQSLLWVNKDANNLKSRTYLSEVNSHVQKWRKRDSKFRYDRARQLHSTVSRTYFPWRRRKRDGEKSTDEDSPERLSERPRSRRNHGKPSSSISLLVQHEVTVPDSYTLAPLSREGRLTSITDSLPSSPSNSILDPFFRLPKDISSREKGLLHLCNNFTTMPRFVYGTHIRAKYCPVRDTTSGEIANNALFMQWILLAAEVYLAQTKGIVDRVSIFERKASIYRSLNKMIADPASRVSTATMSVLAAAPIAEARFGDLELGRKHCVALLHVLNSQGGPVALRSMASNASIALRILVCFVSVGAGHVLFANYIKLLASLQCLKETLLAIQTWSRSFFLRDVIVRGSFASGNLSTKGSCASTYHKFSRAVERYHAARARAFAPDSPLHRFIVPVFAADSVIEKRCHIAILSIWVKVLFDLRNEPEESAHFLDTVTYTVACGRIVPDRSEVDPPQIKALTVLYIAIDCAAKYESVGINTRTGVLRSWQGVEVLELVQLAGHRGRSPIIELLSSSLTGDDVFVAEEEMTAICEEMRLTWMERTAMSVNGNDERSKV